MSADAITPVRATATVAVPLSTAFDAFVALNHWWPRDYTWARDGLAGITLEPWPGGRCYEVGPQGFRLDWGRVLEVERPGRLVFDWRIGPDRVPQPGPETASVVTVVFEAVEGSTAVTVDHAGFERHGDGAEAYAQALGSEYGWPFMLAQYAASVTGD
jgi:uncharacterized protein YndB with AHSA1/START domain